MLKKLTSFAIAGVAAICFATSANAYTVQPNDTMTEIARGHEMSLAELADLNPEIGNIDLIYVGQTVHTNPYKQPEKEVEQPVKTEVVAYGATSYEIDLLARLVRAEAQGESFNGKVAVANVVLNRVASPEFPNSIEGVIYQSGQFSPVTNGSLNRAADVESYEAVNAALSGTNLVGDSLFFYNPVTASSRWMDSKPTVTVIGNHTFK